MQSNRRYLHKYYRVVQLRVQRRLLRFVFVPCSWNSCKQRCIKHNVCPQNFLISADILLSKIKQVIECLLQCQWPLLTQKSPCSWHWFQDMWKWFSINFVSTHDLGRNRNFYTQYINRTNKTKLLRDFFSISPKSVFFLTLIVMKPNRMRWQKKTAALQNFVSLLNVLLLAKTMLIYLDARSGIIDRL